MRPGPSSGEGADLVLASTPTLSPTFEHAEDQIPVVSAGTLLFAAGSRCVLERTIGALGYGFTSLHKRFDLTKQLFRTFPPPLPPPCR